MSTHTIWQSPLGAITLVGRDGALTGLYFPGHWPRPDRAAFGPSVSADFTDAGHQLDEYFAGERTTFDLDIDAEGSDVDRRVWALISQVPYGSTSTYGALARLLGDGTTAQEVGAAVGRNPLCIVVPCHRIVGSTGKLTGYAGGIARKAQLLDLERDSVCAGSVPAPHVGSRACRKSG